MAPGMNDKGGHCMLIGMNPRTRVWWWEVQRRHGGVDAVLQVPAVHVLDPRLHTHIGRARKEQTVRRRHPK